MTASPMGDRSSIRAQWWHLLLLLAVVALLEGGSALVRADSAFPLSRFAQALYDWMPALCGIAVSLHHADRRASRAAFWMGVVGGILMLSMDALGIFLPADAPEGLYRRGGSLVPRQEAGEAAAVSWIAIAAQWLGGGLEGAGEIATDYGLDHPRVRAVHAVAEGGLVLLVFASIAFVIAANSWIRAHVLFKRDQDRLTAQIVVAWLLTPLLTGIAEDLTSAQRFQVLFRGGALWRPLVPYLVILALALVAWRWTSRYRSPAET